MMIKINYIILLLVLLANLQKMESAVVNIGNQHNYFINENIVSDTNIKYLSFCNELIIGYTKKDIQFKVFKYDLDSTKYSNFKMEYILPDTSMQIQVNDVRNNDELLLNINDSTKSSKQLFAYSQLIYSNLYPKVEFSYHVAHNKLNFAFNIKDISSIEKIKFKIYDSDSIKLNLDSSITIYVKNGELNISSLKYLQYDTLSCDTIVKPVSYIVSNDTLMFKFINIDSSKNIITIDNLNDSTSEYNNYYYESKLSQGNLNEKSLACYIDEYKSLYTLNTNDNYSTYNWNSYSSSMSVCKHNIYNNYYLQKRISSDELSFTKQLFFTKDSNQIEIIKMLRTPKNELIVIGNTKNELFGEFKFTFDSMSNKRLFIQNKYNGFIMMLNKSGKCYYANYINYDSTNANVKLTDISNIDGCIYITGIVDSMTNTCANYYNVKYNKSQPYKTFITDYHWKDSVSRTMLISSSGTNEYLTLNNGIMRMDSNYHKEYVFIGTTNSTSILDSTLWNKIDNNNDNIIISFSTNLDSIYKTYKLSGNLNEGSYSTIDSFNLNKAYLNKINDSLLYLNSLSNSNIFYNNSHSYTKNNKDNTKYNCVNVILNYDRNIIDKLLIINSDKDQEIVKTIFADTSIILVIKSESSNFTQPIVKDSLLTDTISSSHYSKGIIININNNLSLLRDIYNNVVYNPLWLTYFENDYSKTFINDIGLNSNTLYIVGNTRNRTYYSNKMYYYNGDNSSVHDDAFVCKINLGYLQHD